MAKNNRCPLQNECGKKCEFENHELDCSYYDCNGIGDLTIPDQEEIRKRREREIDEVLFADHDEHEGIEWIDIRSLKPHPDNPRKELGDLDELAESIKAKGILQNLTVVENDEGDYTIIIGHRRFAAAQRAGLTELPCAVVKMTPAEQVQTMLLENMQRCDLTAYEQAKGFQMMLDFGDTIDTVSEKTGFSKTTIRRRLKMAELDAETLKEVSGRQLSLFDFDRLAEIEDLAERNEVLKSIGTNNFDREIECAIRKQKLAINLPKIKKQLQELHAKKIENSDRWNGKYDSIGVSIVLSEWDGEPFAVSTTDKLFYYLDDWRLELYTQRKKAAPVKRSPEELEKEKIAREALERLREAAAVHFKLRSDFVKGITVTSKNRTTLMMCMAKAMLYSAVHWLPSGSYDRYAEAFKLDLDDFHSDSNNRYYKLSEAIEKNEKLILEMLWLFLGDNETLSCFQAPEFELKNGKLPFYNENKHLRLIYEFLCAFGYEMSDEEKQMLDGTHPLYRKEEEVEE